VLVKLDVDRLVMLDVHEVKRCTTGSNQCQIGLVCGVIESSEISIVNAETILPNVKDSLLRFGVGGTNGTKRIGNGTALNAITTKSLSCSSETTGLGWTGLAFGLGTSSVTDPLALSLWIHVCRFIVTYARALARISLMIFLGPASCWLGS
jgi:hypothetical protein